MGQTLHSHLEPVCLRQRLARGLGFSAWGLLIGSALAAVIALGAWWSSATFPLWLAPALALGGVGIGFAAGFLWRKELHDAAAAIDTHYSLKDRAATALEFQARPDATPARQLAFEDALTHMSRVKAKEVVPFRAPRVLPYALGSVAVMIGVVVLAVLNAPAAASIPEPLDVVVAQADRLTEEVKELEEFAEKEKDPEIEKLVKELKEALKELKEPGTDIRQAMAKLSEMQAALQAEQAKQNVAAVDANMKAAGEALALAEPLAEAGQALAAGDYDKAAQKLEELEEPKLDRQSEKAVKEKLEAVAKKAQSDGQNSLSKAAGEMSKGLGEQGGQFSEGSKKLAGEAKKASKKKKLTDLLMKQCNCLGECKSECEGSCKSTAKGNSNKKGGKNWGLAASGNEAGEQTAALGTKPQDKLKGQQSEDGDVETETTHSPEGEQQAQRDYRQNHAKYQKIAESVLDNEPIPLGHRQTIRKYFESIRPNDAAVDEVQRRTAPAKE